MLSLKVAIPPYAEPVHLTEMKLHCKVETAVTDDDTLIKALTIGARDLIEAATGANVCRCKTLIATTFDLELDYFPSVYVEVPRVPLISVTSITYVDAAGDTQTVDSSLYEVDTTRGRVYLGHNQTWPSIRGGSEDRVIIKFVAGMVAPFTAATSDVFTPQGRDFTVGDRVRVMNSGGALPAGLIVDTDYFVIAASKLSLTSGGSAVDITDTGTGTHYMGLNLSDFEMARIAIKMEVLKLYRNRGDGGIQQSELDAVQRMIDFHVAAIHA